MTSSTIQSRALAFGLACFILGLADAHANDRDLSPLGDFASQTDVGNPALKGSTVYDPETQSYTLSGAGTNMWFDKDEFHFVYKRMKGDFILQTRAQFLGEGVDAHRKLGWMVRSSLDTDSPHINAVVHGDGLTSLQFRRTAGGMTEEIRSELTGADVIQLERRGDRYTMSVARFGQPFVVSHCDDLKLGDEVYVGLFVCSHNPEVIEKAVFKDVRITIPAAEDFVPYRDYLGSRLETLDVDTGDRRVLLQHPGRNRGTQLDARRHHADLQLEGAAVSLSTWPKRRLFRSTPDSPTTATTTMCSPSTGKPWESVITRRKLAASRSSTRCRRPAENRSV